MTAEFEIFGADPFGSPALKGRLTNIQALGEVSLVEMNPNFPLVRLWRVIGGEFDWQIELRSLIPQALHPLALLHRHCKMEYVLLALSGGVGRLGK